MNKSTAPTTITTKELKIIYIIKPSGRRGSDEILMQSKRSD